MEGWCLECFLNIQSLKGLRTLLETPGISGCLFGVNDYAHHMYQPVVVRSMFFRAHHCTGCFVLLLALCEEDSPCVRWLWRLLPGAWGALSVDWPGWDWPDHRVNIEHGPKSVRKRINEHERSMDFVLSPSCFRIYVLFVTPVRGGRHQEIRSAYATPRGIGPSVTPTRWNWFYPSRPTVNTAACSDYLLSIYSVCGVLLDSSPAFHSIIQHVICLFLLWF